MIRMCLFLLLCSVSGASWATCYGSGIQFGVPINVDLSTLLSAETAQVTLSFTTQYSGSFSCTTSSSDFSYTAMLSTDSAKASILGFSNGKYKIRAEILSTPADKELSGRGTHSASELNVPFQVRFSLVDQAASATTAGTSTYIQDVLFVTDLSGMSLLQIPLWLAEQVIKIAAWVLSGFQNWTYDDRDMYGQPMYITYAPNETTCGFDNAGLTVALPAISQAQLSGSAQPGLTPFTLNLTCENIATDGTTTRTVDMYLSSNNRLAADNTVLVDNSDAAAQGVGLRVVKASAGNEPVVFSSSETSRGAATSLYSRVSGTAIDQTFSIPMAVYYYPYNPDGVTAGKINTSATLNIIYP